MLVLGEPSPCPTTGDCIIGVLSVVIPGPPPFADLSTESFESLDQSSVSPGLCSGRVAADDAASSPPKGTAARFNGDGLCFEYDFDGPTEETRELPMERSSGSLGFAEGDVWWVTLGT